MTTLALALVSKSKGHVLCEISYTIAYSESKFVINVLDKVKSAYFKMNKIPVCGIVIEIPMQYSKEERLTSGSTKFLKGKFNLHK